MSQPFVGSDTTCVSDLPLIDLQITDPRILIGQRVARSLQTPSGALAVINDDPNRGYDVRQLINAKLPPNAMSVARAQIQAECLKDEQVQTADVTMRLGAGGALSISISMVSSAGPFTLTMNVENLTVEAVFSF